MNLRDQKYILVKRKTRLQDLIAKYNTVDQAKFYIEHMGIDFEDYLLEDQKYGLSLKTCYDTLSEVGKVQILEREFLPNYLFDQKDIVVVLGQDGLVANTLKYLDNQQVIAINPDPKRWDGVLLPFQVADLRKIVLEVADKKRTINQITMAKATLNNGQVLYGVNDLFIGQRTHISARYLLSTGDKSEKQSSSGVIVSTGLGSTGWLKSVINGAANIISGWARESTSAILDTKIPWNSEYLIYSVREPYPSHTTGASLVFGRVDHKSQLRIQSQMPENGCIFSDGIESDFLEFNSGIEVKIEVADKKGNLVF